MSKITVVPGPDGRPQARARGLGCPDGMAFYEVSCLNTETRWRPARPNPNFQVHLSRSGGFLHRLNGRERFVDPTSVLLMCPSDEILVAHPLSCGDTFTEIEVCADVLAERADGERWLTGTGWYGTVPDELDLQHRALVADCVRGIDPFELTERVHHLLGGLFAGPADRPADDLAAAVGRRPATLAAHRRLTERAREVISGGGFTFGLTELARQVGSSPHHLSRVFHRTAGQRLTAYRNRVRTRAVLTALAAGEVTNLRTLAAEYGFADQSHLTRTLRQQLGRSPTQLRRILDASKTDGADRARCATAGPGEVSTDLQRR